MKILAFTGPRRSGKTFAAQAFTDLNPEFKIKSFAGPLKDMFAKEWGIKRGDLDDVLTKEMYREEMQIYSERYKKDNPYYFVSALFNDVGPDDSIVIDDLRFLDTEANYVIKLGGKIYRVYAELHIRKARGWVYDPVIDNHESETSMSDLTQETLHKLGGGWIFNNNRWSTKEQLERITFNA